VTSSAVTDTDLEKTAHNPQRPSKTITVTWDGVDEESDIIDKRGYGLVTFITGTAHTTAVSLQVEIAAKIDDDPIAHGDPDGDLAAVPVTIDSHLGTDKLAEIPFFRLVQDAAGVGVTKVVLS